MLAICGRRWRQLRKAPGVTKRRRSSHSRTGMRATTAIFYAGAPGELKSLAGWRNRKSFGGRSATKFVVAIGVDTHKAMTETSRLFSWEAYKNFRGANTPSFVDSRGAAAGMRRSARRAGSPAPAGYTQMASCIRQFLQDFWRAPWIGRSDDRCGRVEGTTPVAVMSYRSGTRSTAPTFPWLADRTDQRPSHSP